MISTKPRHITQIFDYTKWRTLKLNEKITEKGFKDLEEAIGAIIDEEILKEANEK